MFSSFTGKQHCESFELENLKDIVRLSMRQAEYACVCVPHKHCKLLRVKIFEKELCKVVVL